MSLSSVKRIRAPRNRMACSPFAVTVAASPSCANTLTSVSMIMDLVTGLTRKPSNCNRSASSRTSSRPNAVTSTMAGGCFNVSSLDVAARLQSIHARHAPIHEHDVVRDGRIVLLDGGYGFLAGGDGVHPRS